MRALPDLINFFGGESLDPYERISRLAAADQLVDLGLECQAVAMLGILDHEYHQECDKAGPRIHDQQPRIRKSKHRAGHEPQHDDECREPQTLGRPDASATKFVNWANVFDIVPGYPVEVASPSEGAGRGKIHGRVG